jgi:hypothetical protein
VALLFPSIFVFLRLLVLEASEIGDLADRRLRVRRNFDEIESRGPRARQCIFGLQYSELISVFVDDSNRPNANLVVDAQNFCYVFISKKEKRRCRSNPTADSAESP